MWTTIQSQQLISEENLFAQGSRAGEFIFAAVDGRSATGALLKSSVDAQARQAVENFAAALETAGLGLDSVVNLMVYLPGYAGAAEVAKVLSDAFGKNAKNLPGDHACRRSRA